MERDSIEGLASEQDLSWKSLPMHARGRNQALVETTPRSGLERPALHPQISSLRGPPFLNLFSPWRLLPQEKLVIAEGNSILINSLEA